MTKWSRNVANMKIGIFSIAIFSYALLFLKCRNGGSQLKRLFDPGQNHLEFGLIRLKQEKRIDRHWIENFYIWSIFRLQTGNLLLEFSKGYSISSIISIPPIVSNEPPWGGWNPPQCTGSLSILRTWSPNATYHSVGSHGFRFFIKKSWAA